MTELERLWRERNDGSLLEAAENLADYTEEAQRVIVDEMARRGLKMPLVEADEEIGEKTPEPQAEAAQAASEEAAVEGPLACLRCGLELQYVGAISLADRKGVLAEFGALLEGSESLNVYLCPQCGHVDVYADRQEEEDAGEGS